MSPDPTDHDDPTGQVDDDTEAAAASSDAEGGAAAEGEYDAAEGSPAGSHPVGESFPEESVRYDDDSRPRTDEQD